MATIVGHFGHDVSTDVVVGCCDVFGGKCLLSPGLYSRLWREVSLIPRSIQ